MAQERAYTYTFKALTDIWTGDAGRRGNRLIATGLLGSIRWWLEVLVRGLGGSACDPTLDGNRCPDPRKVPGEPGHHCVVCELFGCTGWARKFRFEVLDETDQPKQSQIKKGETFQLRFIELRPIRKEEWALLDLTLRIIAEYGAIGGRTTLKNRDYGLIKIEKTDSIPAASKTESDLRAYVASWRSLPHGDFAWASLEHFWFVGKQYLNRDRYNRILRGNDWLVGQRGVSKKVYSFKEPEEARRTFGFVKPGTVDFDEMRQRLRKAWPGLQDSEFLEGRAILHTLLSTGTGGNR